MRRYWFLLACLAYGQVQAQTGSLKGLPKTEPRKIKAYAESGGYHGDIRTGLGFAIINGSSYLSLNFAPELQIGKIRAAFDLEFYIGGDGEFRLRDDMYDEGAGWLRTIRHIYWGSQADVVQVGVGTLYDVNYGTGFLVSHYNNASNWDMRKFGFLIDFNFPALTIEGISNNLLDEELLAGRVGFIPFHQVNNSMFNSLELGVTAFREMDPNPNDWGAGPKPSNDNLSAMGLDVAFSPVRSNGFQWKIFAEYAGFEGHGDGHGYGTLLHMPKLTSMIDLEVLYELRFVNEQFIPGFVNPAYELNRMRSPGLRSMLDTAPSGSSHFTQVHTQILENINLMANYSTPVSDSSLGTFMAEAQVPDFFDPISLSANYTRAHMSSIGEFADLDENSVLRATADWRLSSLLYLSLLYRIHWIEKENPVTGVNDYEKQDTFRPQLTLRWQF